MWSTAAWGSSSGSSNSSSNDLFKGRNGVIYNYERYFFYYEEKPVDDIFAKVTITHSILNEVSNIIKDKNDTYNAVIYNCATFSTEIWNKADNKNFWTGWVRTPGNVRDDIKGNYAYYNGNNLNPSQSFSFFNGSYLQTIRAK